jgi:tetratricopeptide (TPR) repeat protein
MPERHTEKPILTERFDAALVYASAHHRRQLRKGTAIPYTSHLLAVAAIALEAGADEDEAIAALLHDVVEDGGGSKAAAEIRERFGDAVADIVLANSDTDGDGPEKAPWRERKQAYVDSLLTKPEPALLVSLADKLHNARSILRDHDAVGERVYERFKTGSSQDVRWYYRELASAFVYRLANDVRKTAGPAVRELREIVMELDERAEGVPVPKDLPRLYLSLEPDAGTLRAYEFGRIDDGIGEGRFEVLAEDLHLLIDDEAPRPVGFAIADLGTYDPDARPDEWDWPRFDAPQVGLRGASLNEIAVAARVLYGEGPSLNRRLFGEAMHAPDEEAYDAWLAVLQAGDPMAHYALGYTLLDQDRPAEAYRHLRHYTELAPDNSWAWAYRGRAATAIGEHADARASLCRAVELERAADEDETDAREQLMDLTGDHGGARAEALADAAEALGVRTQLSGDGRRETILLDVPGGPVLLVLDADDQAFLEGEILREVYPEDFDDDARIGPLILLCETGDALRGIPGPDSVWVSRAIGEGPDLPDLAAKVEAFVALLGRLREAGQDWESEEPPLTFEQRFDAGPWG